MVLKSELEKAALIIKKDQQDKLKLVNKLREMNSKIK